MNKRGFTLVEVLVTIIIIVILISLASGSFVRQKRRSEYNGAKAIVQSIAATVKNQFYANVAPTGTANTALTNAQYQLGIVDGNFFNYQVVVPGSGTDPFEIRVVYHPQHTVIGGGANTASYIFHADGTLDSCAGADCES